MNLKTTLLIATLGGTIASSVHAATGSEQFSFFWSTPNAVDTFVAAVPAFNTAPTPTYPLGRTLTGVEFGIAPLSTFNGGVQFTVPAGAVGSGTVTLAGTPPAGLSIKFGLLSSYTFSKAISASTGPVGLPGGTSTTVNVGGPLTQGLTGLPLGPFQEGFAFVPIVVKVAGSYSTDLDAPQGTTALNLPVTSSGFGFVRYTFSGQLIPEAETYVAGIALAGLVGWTAHRRLRR